MKTTRITVNPTPLEFQKPTQITEAWIDLGDYIHYRVVFSAEEPIIQDDPDSGWHEQQNDFEIFARKTQVSVIEKVRLDSGKYKVVIGLSGYSTDINIYFARKREAETFYSAVMDWYMGVEPQPIYPTEDTAK